MVFACDTCHFVFECDKQLEQCPDCGKYTVRAATETEEQDLIERNKKGHSW